MVLKIMLFLLFFSACSQATVYTFVEEMPEFPGGDGKLLEFIHSNLKYPSFNKNQAIESLHVVSFIINEKGNASNIKLKRPNNPALEKEFKRVFQSMPKWKPGKQEGKLVKVQYNLPIRLHFQ